MQLSSKIQIADGIFCIVDKEDIPMLSKFKWGIRREKSHNYAACTNPSDYTKKIKMHRLIMNVWDPKILIDHINHDTLDNRKNNLRICDAKGNAMNCSSHKDSLSKYKGVCFCKQTGKWRAQLMSSGIKINIGRFKTEKEAAIAYDNAAKIHHKEFACLNFKNENI